MTESQKRTGAIVLVVVGLTAAAASIYISISANNPKEEIVGTLDMGPKGGRDAEKASGDAASGMPKEMAGSGSAEGKQ